MNELELRNSRIADCSLITLPRISERSGSLTPIENSKEIPFDVERIFYLYDIPGGETRGGHAHKECHQMLVAASGAFDVRVSFAGVDGQMTEEWVKEHNIIAVHEKDWKKYKLKTFRLRMNGSTIDAVVYDMCSDSDCDGCCTENAGDIGFLIDIEKYTRERFDGNGDGVVEWTCLDCE